MPGRVGLLLRRFDDFWFRPESTLTLGVFRLLFGSYLFFLYAISFPNWERFYGPWGLIPREPLESLHRTSGLSLFSLSDSPEFLWALYGLALAASASLSAGFLTRLSTLCLFAIHASQLHRNPPLVNGQDQVASVLLFLSCFAPLGASLSLDRRLKGRGDAAPGAALGADERRPPWAWRLLQLSIALIYVFCGPAKCLDHVSWCDGTALYYVSHSTRWFRYPEVELFHSVALSRIVTFASLALEVLFPYLVWIPRLRTPSALTMMAFHLSILLVLSPAVAFFNAIMVIALVLFLPPAALRTAAACFRSPPAAATSRLGNDAPRTAGAGDETVARPIFF
ncbi:MAG: HTTM domain-containing protein [Planctomycetes bacterium]|nr:HTTM domain-containing protein [Planctomycetota bacterium]